MGLGFSKDFVLILFIAIGAGFYFNADTGLSVLLLYIIIKTIFKLLT